MGATPRGGAPVVDAGARASPAADPILTHHSTPSLSLSLSREAVLQDYNVRVTREQHKWVPGGGGGPRGRGGSVSAPARRGGAGGGQGRGRGSPLKRGPRVGAGPGFTPPARCQTWGGRGNGLSVGGGPAGRRRPGAARVALCGEAPRRRGSLRVWHRGGPPTRWARRGHRSAARPGRGPGPAAHSGPSGEGGGVPGVPRMAVGHAVVCQAWGPPGAGGRVCTRRGGGVRGAAAGPAAAGRLRGSLPAARWRQRWRRAHARERGSAAKIESKGTSRGRVRAGARARGRRPW
jgi:hypothetical protein